VAPRPELKSFSKARILMAFFTVIASEYPQTYPRRVCGPPVRNQHPVRGKEWMTYPTAEIPGGRKQGWADRNGVQSPKILTSSHPLLSAGGCRNASA